MSNVKNCITQPIAATTTDVAGVAQLLQMSIRTVYGRLSTGQPMPPHVRIGYRYVWIVSDVIKWLRDQALEQSQSTKIVRPSAFGPGLPPRPTPTIERRRQMLAAMEKQREGNQ